MSYIALATYKGIKMVHGLCLRRLLFTIYKPAYLDTNISRSTTQFLHTSQISQLKEIHITKTDKVTTIEGVHIKSPREDLLVKTGYEGQGTCPLCALNLNLKHTDVLILSQFLRSDGCILPRRITGLCNKQQNIVQKLVAMAQKAGLMPNLAPSYSKKDPMRRMGSKKLHRYFEESTIEGYYCKYGYRSYELNPLFGKKKENVWGNNPPMYPKKEKSPFYVPLYEQKAKMLQNQPQFFAKKSDKNKIS